jgi:hypothetical protein
MDFLAMRSKYALLGRDFLTWLYYRCESTQGQPEEAGGGVEVFFDDALALAGEGDKPAVSTFKGDPSTMRSELAVALKQGKKIAKAKVQIVTGDGNWSFTIDTDEWLVRSLKMPTSLVDGSDPEAVILDRLALMEKGEEIIERILSHYLKARVDAKGYASMAKDVAKWIDSL